MGHPSLSTVVCVNMAPSLHSRVRACCPSILLALPSVSAGTTGTCTPSISTYIFVIRNILFGNNGQDELFGARNFPISPLGDLGANRLSGSFDGFGRDLK